MGAGFPAPARAAPLPAAASGNMRAMSSRSYGRDPDGVRPTRIDPGFVASATGSALITQGETRVICTASVMTVPQWMAGRGTGWVTAEYGMLPASTGERKARDVSKGRPDGRTVEIQRLIGRSLRGVIDFQALGERTVWIDCDVLTADGGTRCASITGAFVALDLACGADRRGQAPASPLSGSVAAISCGIVEGTPVVDLDYTEDSTAEVDANVVMTGDGGLIEVQATAERTPLSGGASTTCWRWPRSASRPAESRKTRSPRRRTPLAAPHPAPSSSSPPATPTRSASSARCWRPTSFPPSPTTSYFRPRRARRSPRTRSSRRARRRGDRRARRRGRLGHRGRRARRRAGGALGPLRRRAATQDIVRTRSPTPCTRCSSPRS